MKKKIFVVGSINTDFIIRAPYMPAKGETLTGSGFCTAHGGKGANQAVAAARLGGDVVMCACVGDDTFGREAKESLAADGIDVSHVRTVAGTPSGTAVIVLTDGDNRIILDKGANAALCEADVDDALASANAGDILLVQLENPIPTIGYALRKGREKGMFVILNPAPANAEIAPFLSACDLVIPNETEAGLLGGRDALRKTVNGNLIVTLGGDGFELDGKRFPCPKVDPVDTTAAGDTFCGGMVAELAAGKPLAEAAKFGSVAASIACTRLGAQPSIPTRAETEAFLQK